MELQVALNSIASEVFRDQADADYVVARSAWRMRLNEQYHWAALQAIEKYLKGILLYNGLSSRWPPGAKEDPRKQYGHQLAELYDAIEAHCQLDTGHPSSLRDFVERIETVGTSRYLTRSTTPRRYWVRHLDEAVWCIRRFCRFLGCTPADTDPQKVQIRAAWLRTVKDPKLRERPTRLRIANGRLEKIIAQPRSNSSRQALVWNNRFFGSRVRHELRMHVWDSWLIAPPDRPHFQEPALRKQLESFIQW